MKEGAVMQADLMEHSRGCVLDYYLQECSCQTCKNDPACFYCPFSSSSQEHWEINHIISHTHIAPSSIILSTANCKANNNFVQFTKFTCCLIASKIGRMWTLLILTVENEITFFFISSPLWWKWDWITLQWNSTGHIPKHVYGTEQSHWSQ